MNLFQHTFENNSTYVLEKYSFNWIHAVFDYLKQIQHIENYSILLKAGVSPRVEIFQNMFEINSILIL